MDLAATLNDRFVARLGGAHHDEPGGLLGLEQEFTVRTRTGWPADFRELAAVLPIDGVQLDPADPHARRRASGAVITVDGREAEVATPPVTVQPGFAYDTSAWGRAARHELESLLPESYTVTGYSTHLSVSMDDAHNTRVGALYARTFAPGLMLLVDRANSPGLIVRPRPGRTELCGEFVDGQWLRAAAVYAAGSVLACRDALIGARAFRDLPPQLEVVVRPASARAGWYVDRGAFGTDLLTHGRRALLRRCDGRQIGAQEHLEAAWGAARAALGARAAPPDIAAVDAVVGSACPLPGEVSDAVVDRSEAVPLPAASPLGAIADVWARPAFTVRAVAATWKLTVFRVHSRARERDAFASVPRAHLERFIAQLESGALDDLIGEYLALDPAGRELAMTGTEPSIGDVAPSGAAVADRELDQQLAATVPGSSARADKATGTTIIEIPGISVTEQRGCLPGMKWILIGAVVVGLVIGGLFFALKGGGDDDEQQSTASPPTSLMCGENTSGAQIDWSSIVKFCNYGSSQLTGLSYKYDPKPFETATINLGTSTTTRLFYGMPCKIHDATATELDNARDSLTSFRGLSLGGFPAAGLDPGGLYRVTLRAPDQQIRTGQGVADSAGYAEARVPINLAAQHLIMSATYFPSGNANGPSVAIAPTDIAPGGAVDLSFPATRCNRDATLALVPKPTGTNDAQKQAKDTIFDKASVYPLLSAFAHPGTDLDLGGPWSVDRDGEYFVVHGDGYSFAAMPVSNAGGDKAGEPPVSVYYHGGATTGVASASAAEAWSTAFPCGPGQLALTVCTPRGLDFTASAYVAVAAVFEENVPLVPITNVSYGFDVGGNKFRVAYDSKQGSGVNGWAVTGSNDRRVRALIRNNVVLLVVPKGVAGSGDYRIITETGAKHDTQPPASAPAAPLKTTIPVDAVQGAETPQQFVTHLAAALTNGDTAFIRARMHPVVIERYGDAACQAYAANARAPIQFTPKEVHAPTVYKWETDGLSRDVPDTNDVVVTQVAGSQTTERVIHIAEVDGIWRWFTDCGTPLPGAR